MKALIKLIIGIIMSSISISISAQSSFGVKFGTNFSQVAGQDRYYNTTWQNGLQGGFSYSFQFNEKIGFRTDFLYVQKGGKISLTLEEAPTDHLSGIQRVNYLEVPVSIIYVPEILDKKFAFGIGGYTAIGINGYAKYSITRFDPSDPSNSQVVYRSDQDMIFFKRLSGDFGSSPTDTRFGGTRRIDAGIKVSSFYNMRAMKIEISYAHGLINTGANDGYYPSYSTNLRSRSIQLSIIYLLKK